MADMMRAFVMKGIGDLAFTEKPRLTEPGPNGAIVKSACGLVCTSDTHTVMGALGDRENLTLGHEAVGVVERVGDEVKGFKEGDRVAVNAVTPCFQCENCIRGYSSQCTEMLGGWKFANVKDGVFADYSSQQCRGQLGRDSRFCPGRASRLRLRHDVHRFAFDDGEQAFQMMKTEEDGMMKPLIEFS